MDIVEWALKTSQFFFGCGRAFVFALAGVEGVDDIEGDSPAVVALAFVNEDAAGVHCPIVVGGVEYVGGRQFDAQGFVQECSAGRCVHGKP